MIDPKNNWQQRGFSCEIWEDPPGQIWSDFVHTVDELFMTIEGEVELILDSKTFHPRPGEEILIPAALFILLKTSAKLRVDGITGTKTDKR